MAQTVAAGVSTMLGLDLFHFNITVGTLTSLPEPCPPRLVVTVTKTFALSGSTPVAAVNRDLRTAPTHHAFRVPVLLSRKRAAPNQHHHRLLTFRVRAESSIGPVIDKLTINLAEYAARPHRDVKLHGVMENGTGIYFKLKCVYDDALGARGSDSRGWLQKGLRKWTKHARAATPSDAAKTPDRPSTTSAATPVLIQGDPEFPDLALPELGAPRPDQPQPADPPARAQSAMPAPAPTDSDNAANQPAAAPVEVAQSSIVDQQAAEIARLRAQVARLEAERRRDPVYKDVIRELEYTKFVLAENTLEMQNNKRLLSRARALLGDLMDSRVDGLPLYADVVSELAQLKGRLAVQQSQAE